LKSGINAVYVSYLRKEAVQLAFASMR
jgi:hypothetical protein